MQNDNGNFGSKFSDVHTFLNSLVTGTDNNYFLIFKEFSIAGSAVSNTLTGQFFFTGDTQFTRLGTGSQNNGFSLIFIFLGFDNFDIAAEINAFNLFTSEFYAESFSMLFHVAGQNRTGRVIVTGIVYNLTSSISTTAYGAFFNNQNVHFSTTAVNTCCQSGRTAADND